MLLVQTQLESGPYAARIARREIGRLHTSLPEHVLSDATLLVSELVTNAFRHAGRPQGDPIGLRVELRGRVLRIEVTDLGAGRTPAIRLPGDDGGWGLRIVEEVADRWGTTDAASGKVVWFELEAVT